MRWPRQVASVMVVVSLVVVPPVLLVRVTGWPLLSLPSLAQVQRWVAEPITTQTVTAALTIGGWLLWLLVVAAVVLRVLARVRAVARWMRRIPLPTPLQATATGLAGVAVLGTNTATAAAPVADQPAATAAAGDHEGDPRELLGRWAPDQQAEVAGVVVPGGWMPRETAEQVAAAGALLWLRRRRSYLPAAPDPQRRDPDLAPLPAVVVAAQTTVTTGTDRQGDHHTDQDPPAVGRQDGDGPVVVFPPGGVGLTGLGASDAARGILVTVALQALRDPTPAVRLVTTRADLDKLLGPHPPVPAVAGIHVAPTLDDALAVATSPPTSAPPDRGGDQTASRGRLLLLTHGPASDRLAAATAGSDVAVIVLGECPAGDAWSVDASGHVRSSHRPDARRRMCVLDVAAVRDLLTVINPPTAAAGGSPTWPPAPLLVPRPRTPARGPNHQSSRDARRPYPSGLGLRVLGGVSVSFEDEAVTIRRSAALQALVFLAVHPPGAAGRDLVEAIWPGLPSHRVTGRLYTTMSDLRKAIRDSSGVMAVEYVDDRYRLSPDVDVDLWRLHHAVQQATTAVTDRPQAWQAVIDQFGGVLAAGYAWPWLDTHRETVRRRVIDAYVALADAQADPRQALALLQNAIRVDPYNEDLHRRAADILSALGDPDTATELLDAHAQRLTRAGLTPTHLLNGTRHPVL